MLDLCCTDTVVDVDADMLELEGDSICEVITVVEVLEVSSPVSTAVEILEIPADTQVELADDGDVEVLEVGTQGPPGRDGVMLPVELLFAVQAGAGQPVFADLVSGQAKLADAAFLSRSTVIGLAAALCPAGHVCPVQRDRLTLADWSASTGSAALSVGRTYFLQPSAGQLGVDAPEVRGQAVTAVGVALTQQTLLISPTQPILL